VPNCTDFAVCFSRLWVLTRPKLRLRSPQPSAPHGSRNALKEPTQNTAAKKRVRQEDVDSDYLFASFSQRPAFRSTGKAELMQWLLYR
jgi:hypothetical protein